MTDFQRFSSVNVRIKSSNMFDVTYLDTLFPYVIIENAKHKHICRCLTQTSVACVFQVPWYDFNDSGLFLIFGIPE